MKRVLLVISLIVILFPHTGAAQSGQKERADKKYEAFAYIDAIKTYERLAEKGYKSADMFQKLGNAYFFNSDYENAAKWYAQLFSMKKDAEPEYYYRYAQSLKSLQQYDKSDELMKQFAAKSAADSRAKLFMNNQNYRDKIEANSGRFTIADAGVNSEYSDYGSAIFNNQLIFASARDTGGVFKRKHKWTNESFTNLYVAAIDSGSVGEATKFARGISSKFHESTPAFSKDGKTMYFTRNNYNDGKKGKNSQKITLLKVYKSTLQGDGRDQKWSDAVALPFNSDNYSVAHPALSDDGKFLYFASDMPGTLGKSDIFKVAINEDGSFGKPENLGSNVNTPGRETFPFIAGDELYFATDGHPGLGGLDIFMSTDNAGTFTVPENIGAPANSHQDDFAFIIDPQSREGFLTSNRPGGAGNDDIYKFSETRKLTCDQLLSGTVTDENTKEIIVGAKITLSDEQFRVIGETVSDERGYYTIAVNCGNTYYVKAEKTDFNTSEQKVNIPVENGETKQNLELARSITKVAVGDDLAITLKLNPIYFDRDKSFIRSDAEIELEKILDVLLQNPAMTIDVRSHTDSRQTHKYNERLSDDRAKATMTWLIQKGIDAGRLTGKGYGETRLLNNCADNVDCTEEQHQLNRRSEFIITSLGRTE